MEWIEICLLRVFVHEPYTAPLEAISHCHAQTCNIHTQPPTINHLSNWNYECKKFIIGISSSKHVSHLFLSIVGVLTL